MSLISLVCPTKHIIYPNLEEIGEMLCPTLFGGYVKRLLSSVDGYNKQVDILLDALPL